MDCRTAGLFCGLAPVDPSPCVLFFFFVFFWDSLKTCVFSPPVTVKAESEWNSSVNHQINCTCIFPTVTCRQQRQEQAGGSAQEQQHCFTAR